MPSDALPRNQEKPQLYSISVEEFKTAPKEIKPYKPGDKITRDNFVNFLIFSYAISKGSVPVQMFFMNWLEFKFGFDYLRTLENFDKAGGGGWRTLSDAEKNQFREAFERVAKHRERKGSEAKDVVETKIETEVGRLPKHAFKYLNFGAEFVDKISSLAEFIEVAESKIDLQWNQD